jgi:hypothetical protein
MLDQLTSVQSDLSHRRWIERLAAKGSAASGGRWRRKTAEPPAKAELSWGARFCVLAAPK